MEKYLKPQGKAQRQEQLEQRHSRLNELSAVRDEQQAAADAAAESKRKQRAAEYNENKKKKA